VKLRGRMGSMHGFTDVDAPANPISWVKVLDRLAEEPFYRSYQQKVRELLCPVSSDRHLEVGAGTGFSAAKLTTDFDVSVITTDLSQTMSRAQLARGLKAVVTADAEALPFRANVFDGAWADRTMQHVCTL
jgi:ubiquinone/menaquinone biosynthesis C-methylase UbiE